MAPPPDDAPSRARRLERWLAYPRSWDPRVRADGRSVFLLSNRDGLPKAWTVDAAGGEPRPFLATDERVEAVLPSPYDLRAVVASDRGGNENWELSLVGEGGHPLRRLSDRLDRIHHPGTWRDAHRFLYTSNERNPRFFDVYECDVDVPGSERLIRQEDALVTVVRAKDNVALLERQNTNLDTDLFVLEGGTERHVNRHGGEAVVYASELVGRDVYAASNPDREFAALVRYPVSGGGPEVIHEFPGDVERIRGSFDGRRLAGVTNRRGWSDLWVYDLPTSELLALPLSEPGVINAVAWSPNGRELFYDLSSAESGTEIRAVDPTNGVSRAVTSGPTPRPGPARSPQLRTYVAEDGLSIDYWEYAPDGELRGTLVSVHGGPESQARPEFAPMIYFLVGEGYRLLVPNVRGSTGYGRTFLHLDDVRLRMNSVRDLRDLVRAAVPAPKGGGDPERVGVIGGSYGGFMVLSALSTYPELWSAGIDIVGIANFVTFLERTTPWRRKVRENEYGSLEHDREFLESISPLHHVDQIRSPLMVVHGANDPRVPVTEAEQIVAALQQRGVPVEFLRFENEGHGLVRRENQVAAYSRAVEFLRHHLANGDRRSPASEVGRSDEPDAD